MTALAFELESAIRAKLAKPVRTAVGVAYLRPDLPASHDLNLLEVDGDGADPDDVIAVLEEVYADSPFRHRKLLTTDPALVDVLSARDFEPIRLVGMVRSTADPPPGGEGAVVVDEECGRDLRRVLWAEDLPQVAPERREQLVRMADVHGEAADPYTVAAPSATAPMAHARIYVDRERRAALLDHVQTLQAGRGGGFGLAVTARAIALAAEQGAERVALGADVDDWPLQWYERLGFVVDGSLVQLTRVL